jgi:hypothetical protein
LRFVAPCLFLLNSGVTAFAQTPDEIIQAFLNSGNALISRMSTITTPSNAMIIAPDLKALIATYNTNGNAVKALYGQIFSSAAQTALRNNQAALSNMNNQVQGAQTRLLTNDCSFAGQLVSKSSTTMVSVGFTNTTSQNIMLWQASTTGTRIATAQLAPKQSYTNPSVGIDTAWVATAPNGSCIGVWRRSAGLTSVAITPILAPTVGIYLERIAK